MAQKDIALMGAVYPDVPAVTLPIDGGGTATYTDVSDTTATASDVASGKYFYTAAGVKTTGAGTGGGGGGSVTQDANGYIVLPSTGGGGGGGSAQTATGTFTGSGSITQSISCSFAPDLIYIYGDLSSDPSLRGVISITIIKDTAIYVISDGSSSAVQQSLWQMDNSISNYNESNLSGEPYATYSSGTLSLDMVENTSSARFNSSVTYSYKLVKWTS